MVVRPPSSRRSSTPTRPSRLSGEYLAYVDAGGIRVVRWARRNAGVARGTWSVSRPALDWPNLAFVSAASKRCSCGTS